MSNVTLHPGGADEGVTEVQMCFFAALIDGLRLINEKAADRPGLKEDFDPNALIEYERKLIHEVEFFCCEGLGDVFDEAIRAFKLVVERRRKP